MVDVSSNPAHTYAEAIERLEAWQRQETAEVNPDCQQFWLTHGSQAERAVVFFHGYTNCPKQFHRLGEGFFQAGFNVVIPRAPGHGMRDRMTEALGSIKDSDLLAYLAEAVDIACGLGKRVYVVGFSMGGVLAAWAAQHRADVDTAVLIAPALGFLAVPQQKARVTEFFALLLPNRFIWWDPQLKDTPVPPLHGYPRLSTRSLANILRLSRLVRKEAHRRPPKAQTVLVITNPTDEAVDNAVADALAAAWRDAGAQHVLTYSFDAALALKHDIIDPDQPHQQIEVVYPLLIKRITG